MLTSIPTPGEYRRNIAIQEYLESIDRYILAACGEVTAARKIAILMSCIGEQTIKVINNLNTDQKDTYQNLKAALIKHYADVQNVTIERHIFNTMTQEFEEQIDTYNTRLRTQAQKCCYKIKCVRPAPTNEEPTRTETIEHDYTDEMIRDRLICGIQDSATRNRLFREHQLDLARVLEMIRTIEIANEHLRKLAESVRCDFCLLSLSLNF